MTRAPANLLAVRSLLLRHLNTDPDRVRDDDLEPNEVGIVGDANHRGGYHCGSDRVVTNDYSVVESTRDRNGLTLDASALDVGMFRVTSRGRTHDLRSFSVWCVSQCVAGAADTRDIREIIYSPDGRVVRRWDRLGRRTTGDNSHLWHTHVSFFRDATKAGRDQTPLFRRYLTSIGLLEEDMSEQAENEIHNVYLGMFYGGTSMGRKVDPDGPGGAEAANSMVAKLDYTMLRLDALVAQVSQLPRQAVNEQAVIAGVLAGLTPEKLAALLPSSLVTQVADEIDRRMA
ncbi:MULTISPECIES: hypothetical protein [Micromonospora]|uniref:Uncharacterized protein n=1 Tax=Micromonospora yangpuensis TaxID=683228 RepID=A0A1C6UYT1_9ACTN|nr:hypothetical protein [Micromonospora yangpuensis]GGL95609.1 hypothetical protein GCM10012279_11310 [Micromonospora yangpuensis]SCL59196.1 hypothetical protein GA0070617_4030 [Micromonospora yangpuensis]